MNLKMMKEDLFFGRAASVIFRCCPAALTIFFFDKNIDRKCPDCELAILDENEIRIYEGYCPVKRLRNGLLTRSPYLLESWRRKFFETKKKQKDAFVISSLVGLSILFSVNGLEVPEMSKRFVRNLISRFGRNPDDFSCWGITKELDKLNQVWLSEIYRLGITMRIRTDTWRTALLIMGIFLEGMKPIEPLDEEDRLRLHREIQKFLERRHRR